MDCLRPGDGPQRNRGERRVAKFVFVGQHDRFRQAVRQFVFVDVAIVPLDLDVVIPRGKPLQGNAFVVRHAPGIIQLVSGGIVQVQVQVARPLLELNPDITGASAGRVQCEREPVDVRCGVDRVFRAGRGQCSGGRHCVVVQSIGGISTPSAGIPAHIQIHVAVAIDPDRVVIPSEVFRIAVHHAVCQQDPVLIPDFDDTVHVSDGFALINPFIGLRIPDAFRISLPNLGSSCCQFVRSYNCPMIHNYKNLAVPYMIDRNQCSICYCAICAIQNDGISTGIYRCPIVIIRKTAFQDQCTIQIDTVPKCKISCLCVVPLDCYIGICSTPEPEVSCPKDRGIADYAPLIEIYYPKVTKV